MEKADSVGNYLEVFKLASPVYFIAALDILLKEHGGIDNGVPLTPTITLSDLEYADDAALANEDVTHCHCVSANH